MVDVRDLVVALEILFATAAAFLAVLVAAERRRAWIWRAIGRGATMLVVGGVLLGVAVLFFFDAAFLVFHRVFFPQATSRLTRAPSA